MLDVKPDWVVSQIADCAVARGFCLSYDRTDAAEHFLVDLGDLYNALREIARDWESRIEALMTAHPHPWVQFHAAMLMARSKPEKAMPVLEKLAAGDGMWALESKVCINELKSAQ